MMESLPSTNKFTLWLHKKKLITFQHMCLLLMNIAFSLMHIWLRKVMVEEEEVAMEFLARTIRHIHSLSQVWSYS